MRPALRLTPRTFQRSSTAGTDCQICHFQRYRRFSTTFPHHEQEKSPQTFEGYLADKLDAPLHSLKLQPATRTAPEPPPKESLPKTQREETLAKARVVFGSRISGPEERQKELESRSQLIAGVLVPPKPEEPDNCCMSGCVNCVWERFREELEEWAAKSSEARQKMIEQRTRGTATGMMLGEGGAGHTMVSMDDDGGGSETNWTGGGEAAWTTGPQEEAFVGGEESTDPLAGIPVGIREFMKTEKKLKKRHRDAGEVMDTALDKELRAQVWGGGG